MSDTIHTIRFGPRRYGRAKEMKGMSEWLIENGWTEADESYTRTKVYAGWRIKTFAHKTGTPMDMYALSRMFPNLVVRGFGDNRNNDPKTDCLKGGEILGYPLF